MTTTEAVTTVKHRSEIPVVETWSVESVYPNDDAWEAAIVETKRTIAEFDAFRGHLADGPDKLVGVSELLERLSLLIGHVYVYANMLHHGDLGDQVAAGKDDRARALYAEFAAGSSFIDPELIAIGFDTLRDWLAKDERLRIMTHYIDKLEAGQKHVRSAEVEQVLGLVQNPFQTARGTHGILADADLKFEPATSASGDRIQISQGNISSLLTDSDREVRRTAWENYADAHLAFKNSMASCLNGGVKQDVFFGRVRGYNSSLEAALDPDHVPNLVFHNLLDAFKRHLPTWHKYWRVRREALGYDTFHVYDIKAPLVLDAPPVPFNQSMDWVVKGMAPLGPEYVDVMRRGVMDERWVDKYPNQGKHSGAYSGGWKGTHPFILMSYTDDVFSMSTLAHELGHSMHSYNSWQTQPVIYAGYTTFVAEVASNFNQALVRQYLFDTNDDVNFQIALIDEAMANFHRYFFIMPTLARFELELHERAERNEPLSADMMISLMGQLFKEGYGDEVEFDADRIGITWAEFPTHMYLNFYVFQYATGIAAAHALANRVTELGEPAAQSYLAFLRMGGSEYPIDALLAAGVDMRETAPVESAFKYLDGMVDRLAGLVKSGAATKV
jgi:oligoendopeptidase F